MKKTFDQTKKETAKISANAFGIRSIALLMFFVMLFTAIGSGSVLSALAVTKSDDAADNAAAVETVDEASVEPADDIADEPATEEIPAYEYDTEEALLGRKSDSDLAGTGANADLAATGATYYLHYGTDASKNPSNTSRVTMTDAGNNTYTASFTAGSNNYFFGINQSTTAGSSFTSSTSFTSTTTNWGNIEEGYTYYWATSWASEGSTVYVTYNSSTGAVTASASSSGSSSSSDWYVYGKYFGKWEGWSTSDIINMSYDAVTGYYYTTHTVGATEDRFRIYNPNDDHYKPSTSTELVLNGAKVTGTAGWSNNYFGLDNITSGTEVILWWDATNHQVWVTTPETTHDVTFSAGTGGTISPSGTVAVGESTATSVTATASAGYEFSSWTNGTGITVTSGTATGASPTTTIGIKTKASGDYTVQANFTKKPTYPITVMTNSTSLGTAASSVAYGYAGQTITLTATEDAGTFGTWSVVSGGVTVSGDTKTATFTMPANAVSIRANFNEYVETNSDYYYNSYDKDTGGIESGSPYGERLVNRKNNGNIYSYYYVSGRTNNDQPFTISRNSPATTGTVYFQRPDTWSSHDKWSNWADQYAVFFAYDGNILVGHSWDKMTSNGTWDSCQLFEATVPYGTRYVQFNDNMDQSGYKAHTVKIDLTTTGTHNRFWVNSSDGYEKPVSHGDITYNNNPVDQNLHEYFYDDTGISYSNKFRTIGFSNNNVGSHNYARPNQDLSSGDGYYVLLLYSGNEYNINGVKETVTKNTVIWTTELPITPDPNAVTVYAKDGTLRGVDGGNEYETFAKYADTKIYDAGGNAVGTSQAKYGNAAYSYETYGAVKGETITIETTISSTTTTGYDSKKFNELYYVKGFCINGEVPDGTINNSGLSAGTAVDGGTKYTLTYTIPENLDGNKLEITPIYYTADPNVTTVTFQVDNFPVGEHNWGNTLYVYPFYGKLSGANNAMGAYPGQPMVYYGGQYYIQVPTKSYSPFTYDTRDNSRLDGADDAAKAANRKTVSVSGMTLHNGFYDLLHREIWGLDHGDQKNDQTQTYDYDDFYKIYNEKGSDNIIFQYKYETTTDNKSVLSSFTPSDATHFADEFDNGFEYLVDYKGRKVNLFGTVLLESKLSNNPIYVVSEAGGESSSTGNIAGQFATQWHIFVPSSINGGNPTYSKFTVSGGKDSIPPSVLLLEDENSFDNTTYPSALDGHSITDWKTYYTNLKKDYKDNPVLITYEKAKNDVTSDQATRNDGRWLFSATGEPISSNIRIDISQDSGMNYYPNGSAELYEDPVNETGSGYTVPDVSAYFTNLGVNGQQTYSTTLDSDKTYDFTALSNNANYKFMGWYFDNGKKISGSASATTLRNNSYTFVARFMYVSVSTLLLSHVNGKGNVGGTDYQGKGNVSIAVTVTDEEGITVFSDTKSGESITIPDDYIGSAKNYDVSVTLTATPANNNAPGTTVLTKPSGEDDTFFNYGTAATGADGKTKTYTFGFNVMNDLYDGNSPKTKELVYTSYFIPYTFTYNINFEYYDRFDTVENDAHTGTKKIYNRRGTLTADEADAYVYKAPGYNSQGQLETQRFLSGEFIQKLAPVVSNFGEDITWDFSTGLSFGGENSGANYEYSTTGHYEAVNNKDLKRNVTFVLPYVHDNGIATLTDGVGTEATATNYALIKESEQTDNRVNFGEIPVLTGGRSNGIYTEAEKEHWIAAPATIKDASDPSKIKNFNYWSIASTSAPTVEVARCYFAGFNFVAYDNYIITAVYDENPIDISSEQAQTYITFLETTRNQWNTDGNTTANTKDKALAADVLFNDFVLNYSYKAQDLYLQNDGEGDITNLGVVVQRMDQLERSSDGSFNTDLSNYVVDPTTAETDAIKAMINNPTGNNKIPGTTVQAIAKNTLDNKNRIEIFEAIYSAAGWDKDTQKFKTNYAYKKYLYRAFSYMIDSSGNIVLSQKPAYFIMYDVATATNDN